MNQLIIDVAITCARDVDVNTIPDYDAPPRKLSYDTEVTVNLNLPKVK